MNKILQFLACLAFVNAAERINNQLVIRNVDRSIDLASQLVKITATITLENTGKDAVRTFLLVQEPHTLGTIAYLSVKDSSKQELRVTPVKVEGHPDELFHNVALRLPLESGRTTTVSLEEVRTRALEPYPSSITQKDKQLVRYFGNHYLYTPYLVTKQKTDVTLYSRSIENYTKLKPVSISDSTISYGPYSSIEPFTEDELSVHYENNAPFLTVTRLERLIEISHWGNIAVEEHIEIRHNGALLKGPFSRYDYQRDTSGTHHSIKAYHTILPASAHSIYYRDSNGNISTSTVKPRKDWIELELRPRFPLFGGWQSSYTLGYSVPSYQYLFKAPSGENVLNMRLLDHVFDDMHVEELETSVVLPVGASDIQVNPPYAAERLSDELTHKYLDNIGRTVVKLRKTNLVEQHIQDLEITYNWKPHFLLHEPVLLSIALFVMFISVIIWVRLDFSLGVSEHNKRE
ncbi:unnamed protein product [Phaedon cochleariae]|uniref:Dolichyl-diphosphooligosaccharide--protein glycosyltransferase subunit 1 n=1 Tax=Phaedon cochleariae TaxID=80249 RepID=A0A9P0GX33_PHACE|nr:unnamed protein product [Phaedon cochleariae]